MYYLNLDKDGYVLSAAVTEMPDCPAIENIDKYDFSGYRLMAHRWTGEELVFDEEKFLELEKEKEKIKNQEKIAELKDKLTSTDYVVIKIAEGSATAEEYAEIIAQRKVWREEINRLEG